MRLLTLLTLISISSFGQSETYLIDFKVQKLVYKSDSILFDSPLAIEINTSKTSGIIDIGKIGNVSFGIQLEILKSDLENKSRYISGRVYYLKNKKGDWEKIFSLGHNKISINDISNRQEKVKNAQSKPLYGRGNSDTYGDPIEFGVYYSIDYYKQ